MGPPASAGVTGKVIDMRKNDKKMTRKQLNFFIEISFHEKRIWMAIQKAPLFPGIPPPFSFRVSVRK